MYWPWSRFRRNQSRISRNLSGAAATVLSLPPRGAMVLLSTLFCASPVDAADIAIQNTTDRNIHHLYLSPPGMDSWGEDRLGNGRQDTIEAGGRVILSGQSEG